MTHTIATTANTMNALPIGLFVASLFGLLKVITTTEAIITVAQYTMMDKPSSLRYSIPYAITMLLAGELCTAMTIIALIATK